MKRFAITPDGTLPAELRSHLARLNALQVSHLYLRAPRLHADIGRLIPHITGHGIIPIISRSLYRSAYASACAVHTRSTERFDAGSIPEGTLRTASCHSAETARRLLDSGADYVFISPVYRPASKPDDRRPLINTEALGLLARTYGPRIVLLGGLTPQRIAHLHRSLRADFSIAGISMFFTESHTDG